MRLIWTQSAHTDRKAIRDYIAKRAPQAAMDLDQLIGDKANMLRTNPMLGRIGRVENTRELVIHKNYLLIYDLIDDVRILRVLHTSKLWP